jgi:hypothetical protein
MSRWILWLAFAALLAIVSPPSAVGDDSSWKMPNLNPFASKSKTTSRSGSQSSSWKLPSLWQTTKGPVRSKIKPASQPSTLSKMTTGTQQMLSKTADALTPWDNKKPAPPPKITGSNSVFTHNSSKPKNKDSSGVAPASWWSTDKTDSPKSVNEFLSQPRPR